MQSNGPQPTSQCGESWVSFLHSLYREHGFARARLRGRLVSSLGVLSKAARRACQRVERLSDGYLSSLYLCKETFYRNKRMNIGFNSLRRVSSWILNFEP